MRSYEEFLLAKQQIGDPSGFEPIWMPDCLFGFQHKLVEYAIRQGRSAIFSDVGTGKTIQQLVWLQNVVEKTGKSVLLVTPIAVGPQTVKEAEKFGMKAIVSRDGSVHSGINITNYERLHYFKSRDFGGVACDESSILKDCDSVTRGVVTEFLRTIPYRLLCTATPAPNDWEELGTSSEALGNLGWRDMITKFFRMQQSGGKQGWSREKYVFREHAKIHFWRWVCSWARACRKPSDLGFSDAGFELPPLIMEETVVERIKKRSGYLIDPVAETLEEQREERNATINERCRMVAEKVNHPEPSIIWCHGNAEGDLLEKLIPNAVQVSGRDTEDSKERKLLGFSDGTHLKLVIKPKIGAWGMNWQHCNHMTLFPSYSFEQVRQCFGRCHRYGQTRTVTADWITTPGQQRIRDSYERKARQANEMFDALVAEMNDSMGVNHKELFPQKESLPSWLVKTK